MKRILIISCVVLVVVVCLQNRAALLFPFVHDGMTESEVVRLLGGPPLGRGYIVRGHVGTGPARQTWFYHYCFLGYRFGSLSVRFQGDQPMLTRRA